MQSQKEIEVVEILTGTHEIDLNFALQIAKLTYGDMNKALVAVSDYKRGWTKEEVLNSLK